MTSVLEVQMEERFPKLLQLALTAWTWSLNLLKGPKIFCHNVSLCRGDADPDPGSITLMCVEVLTRVCGKHAFFQWDTCYVAQSLCMPAALFQNFLELGISDAATKSNSLKFSDIFDRQFSMDLYAACCRLLYTVLKHHKRESQQCIALLEDSVSVLLHCLETVDIDQAVGKGHPIWLVQEGVKCACSLRRIYEEIRQQKDVLGQHSFQFLSSYIWIYSGYGPLRSGIRREIDEALRPGVYALIDACSPDDLQHIHTSVHSFHNSRLISPTTLNNFAVEDFFFEALDVNVTDVHWSIL
ncbi:hypothetical protein RJ639_021465 [Escallonia herrerae]|uniref:Nucleolar 27S pre-rRNA processing Urb2/Npa2 C-terminal domain-containing protein n=1 Tax=Escallonia herrerae TaxID=1293975 RepID=A0AA88V3H1_9ASTE|nr:hypothetical protein RJ639_021465 [Escallonia herrerae]